MATKRMSLRQIAAQMDITPAYLSYMVNGKRPWREDLYERYNYLVNTSVNSEAQGVNNKLESTRISATNIGGNERIRTDDLALMKRPLCR